MPFRAERDVRQRASILTLGPDNVHVVSAVTTAQSFLRNQASSPRKNTNDASVLTQQHRAIIAEQRLGIIVVAGNIHDNDFIPIERASHAVIRVNLPTLTPLKIVPSETDKGLLVL